MRREQGLVRCASHAPRSWFAESDPKVLSLQGMFLQGSILMYLPCHAVLMFEVVINHADGTAMTE